MDGLRVNPMPQYRSALIVDDEHDIRELFSLTLSRMGLKVETASDLNTARQQLSNHRYDLCITDMNLPDGSGQSLVELITRNYPETPVAMITAHGNVDAAVNALKAGAFDFVTKPVDIHALRQLVQHALQPGEQRRAQVQLSNNKLLGESPVIQTLRATIAKVARSQAPVYICGESGVGKELVARLIHEQGSRKDRPFVPVNCGAIPTELMESEFFGHKKGSFTGANVDKEGLFQAAQGGTLFLDEVAELPLHMQVKLLRVIQEKCVRPIGANGEVATDVRILSATHKDLSELVLEGRFRHDLYYRINVIELRVPPLRERPDDISLLASALLRRMAGENQDPPYQLAEAAISALRAYSFPGNVRELENILERATALCDGGVIETPDLRLPAEIRNPPSSNHRTTAAAPATAAPASALPNAVEQLERDSINRALEDTRYNKTKAAALLGITFRALRYKLKKFGIE